LANFSAEKDDNDGKLAAYVHIRSDAELSLSFWWTAAAILHARREKVCFAMVCRGLI
jgi:hypothetical protein